MISKPQQTIIERLQRGDKLLYSTGRNARAHWMATHEPAVNITSVTALSKIGLVRQERHGAALTVGLYRIVLTDAGKDWRP